jgi:hypothetical protein
MTAIRDKEGDSHYHYTSGDRQFHFQRFERATKTILGSGTLAPCVTRSDRADKERSPLLPGSAVGGSCSMTGESMLRGYLCNAVAGVFI